MGESTPESERRTTVPFGEALRVWAKIGLLGFGGPAGQIALMHRELVERRNWIDEGRFLHALNYCMLLPGPEAQQLATHIGWLLHRTRGGLAAGLLFVLPGFVAILLLSCLYAGFHALPAIAALFFGLKAAVLALVVEAVLRIGKRALTTRALLLVAALAFVGIFAFDLAFPLVVLGAGTIGLVIHRWWPRALPEPKTSRVSGEHASVVDRMAAAGELAHTQPSRARTLRVLVVCLLLWATPIVALALAFGVESVFVTQGVFFSKTAVVTFGGAYAVLTYIAQQAVSTYGWLQPGEMLDGLGLAETTPGPLIMVVQFVAFLAAYRNPGALPPMLAGLLGSLVTVWVTFVPCFLWIFVGAPYIESLRSNATLRAALSCITAAVVGVILDLTLWFAMHFVFARVDELELGPLRLDRPQLASLDPAALVLALAAMLALLRFHVGLGKTLAGAALLGMAWKWFAG
jgi:chromate transporter